jgi:parallel beta-helix repeat protein
MEIYGGYGRSWRGNQMGSTRMRNLRPLLAALVLVSCVARVEAYPQYDASTCGQLSCHPNYFDDQSSPTPFGSLHVAHLTKFGITSCGLCHQNVNGGDGSPVLTYWSAEGYGCAGCHGMEYGQTIPTGLGLSHEGAPKATAYGLRLKHKLAFDAASEPDVCSTCHFPGSTITGDPDPAPAIHPETYYPPYYGRPTDNLTNPCDSSQESWEGTPPGLDNDGNGVADMDDSACMGFVATSSTTVSTSTSTTTTTLPPTARRITVYPGQSIQDAVNAVAPGGTVYIMPGTYQETHGNQNAVTVSKSGIRLIARSKPKQNLKVILKASGAQRNGLVVEGTSGTHIKGFQVKGLTIQGFPNNGILTRYLDDFKIERNESIDNLENGIWPTLSANGLVKRNVAYGSQDSALWVEASENVRVLKNDLSLSPTGLEITVSNNILVKGNEVHNNTAGIGLYHAKGAGLPPLSPPEKNGDWDIVDNYVHDNNLPNTAPPGSLSAELPPGIGMALIGVDRVTVRNNRIENNDMFGIAVAQWCLVAGGCDDNTAPAPGFPDTWPDGNTFVDNALTGNGTHGTGTFGPLAADITYVVLATGHDNCFADNTYSTFNVLGAPPTGAPPNLVSTCK